MHCVGATATSVGTAQQHRPLYIFFESNGALGPVAALVVYEEYIWHWYVAPTSS
jgi:hypothetical protein